MMLLLLACQIEFEQIDSRHVVTEFVDKVSRNGKSVADMWVEQCVAKKEAGL